MMSQLLIDRADLPRWLREADLSPPVGWQEDLSEASLKKHFERGQEWRREQPRIAERMAAKTADACCRECWDRDVRIFPSLLCWGRGAIGLDWVDTLPTQSPHARRWESAARASEATVVTRPKGCLF